MSGTGEHRHSESNLLGVHTHPTLGITEMGGEHEHDIDAFGAHFHWSFEEGPGLFSGKSHFHLGGSHGHSGDDDDETNNHLSVHMHVAEGEALQKSEVTIDPFIATRYAIIRKGSHTELGDHYDSDMAIDILKAEGDVTLVDDYAIRYQHRDMDGCYLIRKQDYQGSEDRKKKVRRMAKSMAEVLGTVEICKIHSRAGNALVVQRVETITAVEKAKPAFLRDKDDEDKGKDDKGKDDKPKDDKKETKVKKVADLHSIVLEKSLFPTLDIAGDWMKKNNLGHVRHLETAGDFTFYTGDRTEFGKDELETRTLGGGIVAFFGKCDGFETFVEFKKFDEEKGIVYGTVYEPLVEDSQGDWATADDIQKAAHDFLMSGAVSNVDTQHDFEKNGSSVVESFIAREGDPDFSVGTWAVGVLVAPTLRPLVKSGDINGFSMAGGGTRMMNEPLFKSAALGIGGSVPIAKAHALPEDEDDTKLKKSHRLTNIHVGWISLVHRGANGQDFAFRKSADSEEGLIFKSADRRIIEGEFKDQNVSEGLIQRIVKAVTNALSTGHDQETGTSARHTGRMDPPMSKIDNGTVGVLNILKGLMDRTAASERLVQALAKSPALESVLKSDPALKEQIAKINPEDLEKFTKALGDFVQQGANNNGVTLPPVKNMIGFAMDPTVAPSRFFEGNFPGGGIAFGEPTVDKLPVRKADGEGLDALAEAVGDMQKELATLRGDGAATQKEDFQAQIAEALTPVAKAMEKMGAVVATLQKAATQEAAGGETPADGTELSTATPAPAATPAPTTPIEKSEDATPKHPFGTADELFGGIKFKKKTS